MLSPIILLFVVLAGIVAAWIFQRQPIKANTLAEFVRIVTEKQAKEVTGLAVISSSGTSKSRTVGDIGTFSYYGAFQAISNDGKKITLNEKYNERKNGSSRGSWDAKDRNLAAMRNHIDVFERLQKLRQLLPNVKIVQLVRENTEMTEQDLLDLFADIERTKAE